MSLSSVFNNHLCLGFEDGSLALLQTNHIEPLVFEEGHPKKPIRKILFDKRGIIWVATAGEGIYYLQNKRMYNINEDDGLSDNYVYDIAVTKEGFVKAATDRGLNIISINGDKKDIKVFSSKNGLPDNILRCLSETTDAFSWLGMQDAGIVCLDNNQRIQTTIPNWSFGQVNDVVATSSQVFIATEDNGLLVYDHDDKNSITTVSYHDVHIKKITTLFRDRESNIWVAGDHFLMRTPGSNIEMLYTLPKPFAEKIHSLLYGADKTIWFNTGNNVSSIARSGNIWKQTNYIIKNIDNTDISCLYQDKWGIVWIGTLGKGIILLDPSTGIQKTITDGSGTITGLPGNGFLGRNTTGFGRSDQLFLPAIK